MMTRTKIKMAAALALVITLAVGVVAIQSLRADNRALAADKAQMAEAMATSRAEADTLRQELKAGQAALMAREHEKAALATQTEELRSELERLYQSNEPCAAWADGRVPDPVYRRLRK